MHLGVDLGPDSDYLKSMATQTTPRETSEDMTNVCDFFALVEIGDTVEIDGALRAEVTGVGDAHIDIATARVLASADNSALVLVPSVAGYAPARVTLTLV